MYTLLTWLICVLSNIRERLCPAVIRWDRTLAWDAPEMDAAHGVVLWKCCDCGLEHFHVIGKTQTPVRPLNYRYRLRAGRGSSERLDPRLGPAARDVYVRWCAWYGGLTT